jgi:hypothetical protein
MNAEELFKRLMVSIEDRPLRDAHPEALSVEDMLGICLEWLDNVSALNRSLYLRAMPNNVPGVATMVGRFKDIERSATSEPANPVCLFPGSHEGGHSPDRKFTILFHGENDWRKMTEAEILAHDSQTGFMHVSAWDFWWEEGLLPGEVSPRKPCPNCGETNIPLEDSYCYGCANANSPR